jgi:hypothetical protein
MELSFDRKKWYKSSRPNFKHPNGTPQRKNRTENCNNKIDINKIAIPVLPIIAEKDT